MLRQKDQSNQRNQNRDCSPHSTVLSGALQAVTQVWSDSMIPFDRLFKKRRLRARVSHLRIGIQPSGGNGN